MWPPLLSPSQAQQGMAEQSSHPVQQRGQQHQQQHQYNNYDRQEYRRPEQPRYDEYDDLRSRGPGPAPGPDHPPPPPPPPHDRDPRDPRNRSYEVSRRRSGDRDRERDRGATSTQVQARRRSLHDDSSRRPAHAPPPPDTPDFTTATLDAARAFGSYSAGGNDPPADFNPNQSQFGAGQELYGHGAYAGQEQGYYQPQYEPQAAGGHGHGYAHAVPAQSPTRPAPAQSQYEPASPARTRQRSISGGQRSGPAREAREAVRAEHRRQEGEHYPARLSGHDYAFDDKSSNGHLVRGGSYSTQGTADKDKDGGRGRGGGGGGHDPMPGVIGNRGGAPVRKGGVPFEEMGQFFGEISDLQQGLREANGQIQEVGQMQLRLLSLPSADDPQAIQLSAHLTEATQHTRAHFNSLKARISALDQGNANLAAMIPLGQSLHHLAPADVQVRATQVGALKERFRDAVQRYAEVERDHRAKNRSRMERQVRVVNPGLGADEVAEVVREAERGGGAGLFSQAVLASGGQRSHAARGALREVETRAAELARIEETLVELAQLFNDMAVLVEAQDVAIVQIEQNAVQVEGDMEKGTKDVKRAVVHARSARKMRWWCCGIVSVIIVIVVVVVVVEVVLPMVRKNNDSKAA